MDYPLEHADAEELGLAIEPLERLVELVERQVAEGRYPGAQLAVARHGRLLVDYTLGEARIGEAGMPADGDTLWLLYSNTKVLTAAALWRLAEAGALAFGDRIAEHVPEFAQHGKEGITVIQLLTHQGGFPKAEVPREALTDHAVLREAVCNFVPEFAPGSKVHYHGQSAHWVAAVLIEALTGRDFRDVILDEVIRPLGLEGQLYVGVPDDVQARCADMHQPGAAGPEPMAGENGRLWRNAGSPGAGGYGTARAMAAFYQMLAGGGTLAGRRFVSPRTVAYVTRNFTGDRVDEFMGMPMHRGLGPHVRGSTDGIRGLGSFAHPSTFGHGGVGSSYCWADPESGVSFAYLTNCRVPDPWHSRRLDIVSNFVHQAIRRD